VARKSVLLESVMKIESLIPVNVGYGKVHVGMHEIEGDMFESKKAWF